MDTNDESAHALLGLFLQVRACVDVHVLGRWMLVTVDANVMGGWCALLLMLLVVGDGVACYRWLVTGDTYVTSV